MKWISLSSRKVAVLFPQFGYPFLVIQQTKRNEGLVFSDRDYVILLYTICSSEYLHGILIWYSTLDGACWVLTMATAAGDGSGAVGMHASLVGYVGHVVLAKILENADMRHIGNMSATWLLSWPFWT
jgi:hypothetical protein